MFITEDKQVQVIKRKNLIAQKELELDVIKNELVVFIQILKQEMKLDEKKKWVFNFDTMAFEEKIEVKK